MRPGSSGWPSSRTRSGSRSKSFRIRSCSAFITSTCACPIPTPALKWYGMMFGGEPGSLKGRIKACATRRSPRRGGPRPGRESAPEVWLPRPQGRQDGADVGQGDLQPGVSGRGYQADRRRDQGKRHKADAGEPAMTRWKAVETGVAFTRRSRWHEDRAAPAPAQVAARVFRVHLDDVFGPGWRVLVLGHRAGHT